MRRGSIIGPLILIVLGILFLVRNVWREIPLVDILSRYWPYLLIAWGVIRLFEIFWGALKSKPLPQAGISGGEWMLVVLICILGAGIYTAHRYAGEWLPAWRGVMLNMGGSFDYPLPAIEKPCPKNCRVLIENFRGNARITGGSDAMVRASGRESIRSFQRAKADGAAKQTAIELISQGNEIILRTSENVRGPMRVSYDLEITVPMQSSIEAHGRFGDFNIQDVSGPVNVEGSFPGEVQLGNVTGEVRYRDPRVTFHCESLPGDARISSGDFTANNLGGPVLLTARSRDVRISGVTQSLELTLDRGDIELRPGKAVPQMVVRTRSGDIDLALAPDSKFDLNASTERGEAQNEFGEPLGVKAGNRGATIAGSVPGGPQLRLSTNRGDITVRKLSSEDAAFPEAPRLPTSTDQPLHVERQ